MQDTYNTLYTSCMNVKTANKPRTIKSFEPTPDVLRMLGRANERGIKFTFIANNALRDWLQKNGFAGKKDLTEAN